MDKKTELNANCISRVLQARKVGNDFKKAKSQIRVSNQRAIL